MCLVCRLWLPIQFCERDMVFWWLLDEGNGPACVLGFRLLCEGYLVYLFVRASVCVMLKDCCYFGVMV